MGPILLNLSRSLTVHTSVNWNLRRSQDWEDWFQPVLNKYTPLFPTLSTIFLFAPLQPSSPSKKFSNRKILGGEGSFAPLPPPLKIGQWPYTKCKEIDTDIFFNTRVRFASNTCSSKISGFQISDTRESMSDSSSARCSPIAAEHFFVWGLSFLSLW